MLETVKWGEYKITDLFTPLKSRGKLSKEDFSRDGDVPVYSSDTTNNGVLGFTKKRADYKISEEVPMYLVFGDHTRTMNIAIDDFSVMDNVKVLIPKIANKNIVFFICSSWKKVIPNLGYARHWSIAGKSNIMLPSIKGEINFDFMETFISEFEIDSISKLSAYLNIKGLKDYNLTKEEERVLFEYQNTSFKEFNSLSVFDIKNTKNILSKDIIENSGTTPYLCASSENNAISSYIAYDKNYMDEGNCIFIGGKTFIVSYQENNFYSNDSHNLALYLRNTEKRDKLTQLYLSTCVNKSLGHKYSWGDSISNAKIKKDNISLPVKDNDIDYDSMQILISAIQKLVIKDVVLYCNNKTKTTNNLSS